MLNINFVNKNEIDFLMGEIYFRTNFLQPQLLLRNLKALKALIRLALLNPHHSSSQCIVTYSEDEGYVFRVF
jgi:glucose-6-phosphate isomerase